MVYFCSIQNGSIVPLLMRSSLVVRASDCQCTSCNGPGFDPSIRRHSGIWGAADEAVLNIVWTKRKKIPPQKKKKKLFRCWQVGDGRIFLKTSAPLSLMKTFWMKLISAGSISLDSSFNTYDCSRFWHTKLELGSLGKVYKSVPVPYYTSGEKKVACLDS